MPMRPDQPGWVGFVLSALLLTSLGGCASNNSIEDLGSDMYALDCSGGAFTWAGCHALAQRACAGRTFEIKSQVSNEGSGGVGINDWSTAGSEVTRTMVVECQPPQP